MKFNEIYLGDSFELIEEIKPQSIDLILEDMPYNSIDCEWDIKIDLQRYWESRKKILKPNGIIILTAQQPFATDLISTNRKMFRYEMIWNKILPVGFLNSKKMPMRLHENILIYYSKLPTFNPQKRKGLPYKKDGMRKQSNVYTNAYLERRNNSTGERMPTTIIEISNADRVNKIHPTQKPIDLFEYLIRTYTNEGDLIFDGFGGSCTTAIAAYKSKRNFIVIEKEKKYYDLALIRLNNEKKQLKLL